MSITLEDVINDYKVNGCASKVNTDNLNKVIDNTIEDILYDLNKITSKYTKQVFSIENYKEASVVKVFNEDKNSLISLRSKIIRNLNYRTLCIREKLMDLSLLQDKFQRDYIACNHLSNKYNNSYLSDCVEEDDILFTFSFVAWESHLLYRSTGLSKFFGTDFIKNILNYLESEGVIVDKKSLGLYLMLRTWSDNYSSRHIYLDNRGVLNDIDLVLRDLTTGVLIYKKECNPRSVTAELLLNLINSFGLDHVHLYHFDYDNITLKINPSVNKVELLERFNDVIKDLDLLYIPCNYSFGNSLIDNLNSVLPRSNNDGDKSGVKSTSKFNCM